MLAEQIMQQDLSVREAEQLVKKHLSAHVSNKSGKAATPAASVSQDILSLQETLSEQLGATVSIKAQASGAGVLKISYASLDQLDEIIAKISR